MKLKASGALFLVSAETLAIVSQLLSVVTEIVQPVEEMKDDEEDDDKVPSPPPLTISEHFPPSLASTKSGWLTQQPLVLGMPAPFMAQRGVL